MFEDLLFFLNQRTSEYRTALLIDNAQHCYDIMGTPILDKLNQLVEQQVDVAADVAVDYITDFLLQATVSSMSEFGVVLNPDAITYDFFQVYNDILETLLNIDQYEDPHCILSLLEDVDDTEEALAIVVEELTGQHPENVLDVIGKVDCDLVQRIQKENAEHAMSLEARLPTDEALLLRQSAIDRLKHSEYFNKDGFIESRLCSTGMFGADPFAIVECVFDELGELPAQELATACYQLACASNVATNAVIGTAKQVVERVVTEDQTDRRQRAAYLLNRYPIPSVEV